jgi:hypothetical protein
MAQGNNPCPFLKTLHQRGWVQHIRGVGELSAAAFSVLDTTNVRVSVDIKFYREYQVWKLNPMEDLDIYAGCFSSIGGNLGPSQPHPHAPCTHNVQSKDLGAKMLVNFESKSKMA